jgi:GNAT superfamily N-acetyltransferase
MSALEFLDPDDWETWRDLRLRALQESPDAFGSTYDRELGFTEEDWRHRAGRDGYAVVATDGGVRVAMGGGFVLADEFLVFGMWTDRTRRRRGHATAILDALLSRARDRELPVAIHVNLANPAARAAYESYGFVATGELEPLRPGSDQQVELLRLPVSTPR